MPMQQGCYIVTISGNGLNQFSESVLIDNQLADIILLNKSNEQVQYILKLSEDADSTELRGLNIGDNPIEIYAIEIGSAETLPLEN